MALRNSGDRVSHATYGDGTIQSINEYHTVILFDAHGARTFVSPRVVLTEATTPAPEKPVRAKKKAAVRKKAVPAPAPADPGPAASE